MIDYYSKYQGDDISGHTPLTYATDCDRRQCSRVKYTMYSVGARSTRLSALLPAEVEAEKVSECSRGVSARLFLNLSSRFLSPPPKNPLEKVRGEGPYPPIHLHWDASNQGKTK